MLPALFRILCRLLPFLRETCRGYLSFRRHPLSAAPAFSTGNRSLPDSAFVETYVLPNILKSLPSTRLSGEGRTDVGHRRRVRQHTPALSARHEAARQNARVHAQARPAEAMLQTDGKTLSCKS